MLAIFYLSAQSALGEMTGPPVLMVARKCGHIFEYAALALLLGRALLYTWRTHASALSSALLSRVWGVGVALAALYAMTDEFHQTFVPKRGGRVEDVVLDTLSAVAALGFWYRWKARQLESPGPGTGDRERKSSER
jgi:VanZ family protein